MKTITEPRLRIVCMSDTHSFDGSIGIQAGEGGAPADFVPDGDVLIHAGDLTDTGEPDQIFNAYAWLSEMPHEHIIVVPGNHDFGMERLPQLRPTLDAKFPRITTLIDEATEVHGLKVYGSPWQPWFHDWAYNFPPGPAGEQQAEEVWAKIPDDTNILVTHGPPYAMLDTTLRGKSVGCAQLKTRIAELKELRLHVFGHIHEQHGTKCVGDILYVNACVCDHLYDPVQKPILVEWDGKRFSQIEDA